MKEKALRDHLLYLLKGGGAHLDFDAAVKGLPAALRGKRPKGSPHSPWELVEHMRIAQWDILDFCRNRKYKARAWPAEYWPATQAPPSAAAWNKSIRAFRVDLDALCALVSKSSTDLHARIPHGEGQTILREEKRCWSPTTTPIIWDNWCWCGVCWAPSNNRPQTCFLHLRARAGRLLEKPAGGTKRRKK